MTSSPLAFVNHVHTCFHDVCCNNILHTGFTISSTKIIPKEFLNLNIHRYIQVILLLNMIFELSVNFHTDHFMHHSNTYTLKP